MKQNLKKSAVVGIACELVYFFSVTLFLITKNDFALTLWEIMTVIGAIVMLIVLSSISEGYSIKSPYRKFMLISLSGTVFLSSAAHFTSIGVIRKLAAQGEPIPDYFKIGFFPSVEMTLDYIAWGLFMGFAFLSLFLGINHKTLKILSLSCGILCFIGFIGSFFFEYLWYPAPLGYGIGFLIMCIYIQKNSVNSD